MEECPECHGTGLKDGKANHDYKANKPCDTCKKVKEKNK